MKKVRALILTITLATTLLLLVACSSSSAASEDSTVDKSDTTEQATPETSDIPSATEAPEDSSNSSTSGTGFYVTTSEKLPLKLETPDAWVYVDPTESEKEKLVGTIGDAGFVEDVMEQVRNSDVVFFYDTANYSDNFKPNMNILKQGAIDMKQSELSGAAGDIKTASERDFSKAPFEKFSWVAEPQGKKLGSNYYVVFVANYTAGVPITGIMAYTIYDGYLYQFTYSITQDAYTNDIYSTYEKVLASVEFG
ncbi:MAG: hypothetical protein FWG00_00340 [Coriobacteriia bacterium]|nr:hypothetical protein [Coriobacteriia bacterium]